MGVVEAKKEGVTLTGVETQSARYAQGPPPTLPSWRRPLPFLYESTGVKTHFTNGLDPQPRARPTFAFHRPDSLAAWLTAPPGGTMYATGEGPAPAATDVQGFPATFLSRVQQLPPLVEAGLWPAQIVAIRNPEKSLAANMDGVKQHGRLNDNHLGRLDGDDCRRLLVHVVAPVNG